MKLYISGKLPNGLVMNPQTGAISGVPEEEKLILTYTHVPDSVFPHRFESSRESIPYTQARAINQWCVEQWGIDPTSQHYGGKRWWVRPATGSVMFADQNDAFAFRMRWC